MSTQVEQKWYYVDDRREKQGPFNPGEFKALADQGVIRPATSVWGEGYRDWVPASQVDGLVAVVDAPAPAPAGPPPPPLPASPSSSATGKPAAPTAPAPPSRPALPVENLKPRKESFLFPRVVTGLVLFGVLAAVTSGVMLGIGASPLIGIPVFVLGLAFTLFAASAAYRKERYELHPAHILCHSGGLLSDQTSELEFRNITHVKLKLPWLRYKFFRVGDVIVQSAGTSEPLVMRSVRDPEKNYAGVRERMQRNGYDLTQSQLLHEERPALIAVIGECIGIAFVTVTVLLFGFSSIAGAWEGLHSVGAGWVLWILGGLMVAGAPVWLVVHFLDLRRRTYRVYNDTVVYEEGFLTRENAFIPYENIADAATKRSFIDQILNLYDVLVSCQGSSAEIKFRRLRGGVALSDAIDHLVVQARQKPAPSAPASASTEATAASKHKLPRRAEPDLVAPAEAWVADLRMCPGRVLVPLMLLLVIPPIGLVALIGAGIKLMSTRYFVRPGSIRHSYHFLTTHDREFAYDKITGLVIKENLWDRLFGSVTLRFWSIGSSQALELAHVSHKTLNLDALMSQVGIPAASADPCTVRASFGVLTWLRARIGRLLLLLLFAAGLAVAASHFGEVFHYLLGALALVSLAGFGGAWLHYSRQRLRFHRHHVEAEQGVITRHRYYARYRNVKKNQVTRYPGGSEGALQIFVAGEQEMGGGNVGDKKGKVKMTRPYSFTSGFLPAIMEKGRLVDDILCGRVDPGPASTAGEPLEVLYEAPRAAGNTLVKLIFVSILLLPLVVLLPLTIPAALIAAKRWRYRLEAGRVVATWGLLYRKEASILLDRIDSLRQNQGAVNKMFRNGNVNIMTAGSSKPDLVLRDAPDYQRLYNEIRALSQGG